VTHAGQVPAALIADAVAGCVDAEVPSSSTCRPVQRPCLRNAQPCDPMLLRPMSPVAYRAMKNSASLS
jgi:hypothetical protein